jgi:AAA domain
VSIFKPATNTQARLKAGIMGFAGDGKTYTAATIAIGLIQLMRSREIQDGEKPVMFLDTETGSDWVAPRFSEAGIELVVAKTRSFSDLLVAMREADKSGSVIIIDSISHFWRELTETYAEKRNRKSGLQFQDWAFLKAEWGKFTDLFVNSNCHAILCGRAGYEYDFFENDSGKKELQKTGIKMKAETETGYEPSILILMQKHRDMATNQVWRDAHIIKDRSTRLDGKTIVNPTFEHFLPHVEFLNLGGHQLGVDTSRNSGDLIGSGDSRKDWKWRHDQREIALDEIVELLNKHHGGASKDAKDMRASLVEKHAQTRSWERVKTMTLEQVQDLRNRLWRNLEGIEYNFTPPAADFLPLDPDDTISHI